MNDKVIEMEGSHASNRGLPVVQERNAVQVSQGPSPAEMIQYVMKNGGTIEQLREFMALKREMEADEAKKAFNVAMAEFSAEPLVITKDKENKQFKSMYTGIGNLVNTVRPLLSKYGFSVDWKLEQPNGQVKVTCVLSHALGHTKEVSFTIPPDTSGGGSKNPIQQIKSSMTYARSATFEAVCGLASSDANLDDDGAASGKYGTIDTKLADEWIAKIKLCKTDDEITTTWKVGVAAIKKAEDMHAYNEFKNAVEQRHKEIAAGSK